MLTAEMLYNEHVKRDIETVSLCGDPSVVLSSAIASIGVLDAMKSLGIGPHCTMRREDFDWMVRAAGAQ